MQAAERRKRQKIRFYRVLLVAAGFFLLTGISTFAWFKIEPISFRQYAFEPLRDGLFFYRELQPITGWRQLLGAPSFRSRRVEIPGAQPGDLTLIADFWEPDNRPGLQPALLILHGSSGRGRRQGLVRMLAHEFQRLGWVVLTPDARGFGESEDPQAIQDPESWRNAGDVNRCLDFLFQIEDVDKRAIVLIGHSMGGGSAMEGALDDPRVASIILIGPPRYISGTEATFWGQVRFSADRKLREVISESVMADRINAGDIARFAHEGRLRQTPKPILLLDGGMESEAEHRFLQEVSRKLSASSSYHTVTGAGHYCGVYHIPGTDFIVWRQDLFEACTAPTMAFVEKALQFTSRPDK